MHNGYYKLDVLNVAHNIFIISNHFKLFRIFEVKV